MTYFEPVRSFLNFIRYPPAAQGEHRGLSGADGLSPRLRRLLRGGFVSISFKVYLNYFFHYTFSIVCVTLLPHYQKIPTTVNFQQSLRCRCHLMH